MNNLNMIVLNTSRNETLGSGFLDTTISHSNISPSSKNIIIPMRSQKLNLVNCCTRGHDQQSPAAFIQGRFAVDDQPWRLANHRPPDSHDLQIVKLRDGSEADSRAALHLGFGGHLNFSVE